MNNYKKVEKLLEDYAELDINIKGIELDIKEEGLKGVSYSDMPGAPLPSNKSVVEIGLNTIEKLKREKMILEIKKEKIENMFRMLDDTEYNLIKYRYFDKLSFKEISYKLNLNDNYLLAKRNKIINKLVKYAIKYRLI